MRRTIISHFSFLIQVNFLFPIKERPAPRANPEPDNLYTLISTIL